MLLTRFCLRNPIAVTIFFVFVVLLGVVAYASMGRSILPPIRLPVVAIAAPYPGAGPEELERVAIEPIEDALDDVPDVERVTASAQNGVAEIAVQFHFGTALEVDRENVQRAVNAATPNMPSDLVPPTVSNEDPTAAPILEESIASGVLPDAELAQLLARSILPAIRSTRGVGSVTTSGAQIRQFTIRPNAAALDALRATSLDVLRALELANDALPGGSLRTATQEASIDIDAAATSATALENVPISIPSGATVRLRDVARVIDGNADQTVRSRVDGNAAILLYVSNASGSDALRTIAGVRNKLAAIAKAYPLVRFTELRTDEPYTQASVDGVLQTLGEGVVLTVLVMLVFLRSWRHAAIAAVAIPTSLCAALGAMWAAGFTINVLSLMGLSLTIGILVDDSIVIIEAITSCVARGLAPFDAALEGRRELGAAAFAITLVDVAVFAPIALMSGLVGEFMREFGLVIVFATGFSLLVALTITPLLAATWGKRRPSVPIARLPWTLRTALAQRITAVWRASIDGFNVWETEVANRYANVWLPVALRRGRLVTCVAAGACGLSLLPVVLGWIPSEFSPSVNRGEVTIDITMPAGTPLARTDEAASVLSNALLDDDRIKHVEASVGRSFNGSADVFATNVAQLGIILRDSSASGDDVLERAKSLGRLIPSASLAGAGRGMGGAAPISYSIGGDPAAVSIASRRLVQVLEQNPYAADIRTTDGGIGPHVRIRIDPIRARELNVSADDVAQTARTASGGTIAMKARLTSGLVSVVVQADATRRGDLPALAATNVRSADGRLIPLADLVTIERSTTPTIITRENRERVVTVSANTAHDAPIGLVTTPLARALLDGSIIPSGAHIAARGDLEQFLDTVGKILAALGLSTVVVYAILALLYRSYTLPFVVMVTVPLASIGAFGALALTHQPLNLYSMLGIIMLVGLVAKNGILLIDYAERGVRDGSSAAEAMREAARRRFRPILMTTLAMIAGMAPLALGDTIGAQYRQALGTVVIGGLTSSLLLTFLLVPVVYVTLKSRQKRHEERPRTLPREHAF